MAARAARAKRRAAKAAKEARDAELQKESYAKGDAVTWIRSNDSIPTGTIGIVKTGELTAKGNLMVIWPSKTSGIKPTSLRDASGLPGATAALEAAESRMQNVAASQAALRAAIRLKQKQARKRKKKKKKRKKRRPTDSPDPDAQAALLEMARAVRNSGKRRPPRKAQADADSGSDESDYGSEYESDDGSEAGSGDGSEPESDSEPETEPEDGVGTFHVEMSPDRLSWEEELHAQVPEWRTAELDSDDHGDESAEEDEEAGLAERTPLAEELARREALWMTKGESACRPVFFVLLSLGLLVISGLVVLIFFVADEGCDLPLDDECGDFGQCDDALCVCLRGYVGDRCEWPPAYTVTGCREPAHCGTFDRTELNCSDVWVYQKAEGGGEVLFLQRHSVWQVGPNTSLEACSGEDYLRSGAYAFPPRMPSLPHFRWPSNASVVANWTGHSSGDFVNSGE